MKLAVITLLCSFLSINQVHSLELSLDVYEYQNTEQQQSYVETYLRILGSTVSFQKVEGGKRAAVNITITIEQGEKIIAFDKFKLNSPLVQNPQDFLDLKRFGLSPGTYAVHVIAIDDHNETNKIELKQFVEVTSPTVNPQISDVVLLADAQPESQSSGGSLVKHGLYMEPVTYGYLGEDETDLIFFSEVYNVPAACYVKYSINQGYIDDEVQILSKYKKIDEGETVPLVLTLPIDEVRTGNYHLELQLYDKNKKLLAANKSDFIRSNPNYDKIYWEGFNETVDNSFVDSIETDKLRYHLLSLIPVAKEPNLSLLATIIDLRNEMAQRHFLYNYWKEQSPKHPEHAFKSYTKVVDMVDDMYDNNVGFGFQTDRGHMFLKYGKPNNVLSIDNEPDAYPYEIWYYSQLNVTRQTDVKFLFYNPSLAHNDYQLLHASCIGERNNPAWEVELYRRAPESQMGATIEATEVQSGWNRRAKEYFNEF